MRRCRGYMRSCATRAGCIYGRGFRCPYPTWRRLCRRQWNAIPPSCLMPMGCATGELSPALRLVTILRYFTGITAYDQMAQVCGVPIGTVRSRLSQARSKLHEALLRTADLAHDDVAMLTGSHRRGAQEMLDAAHRGTFGAALTAHWNPDLEITWPQGKRTNGFDYLMRVMDSDYDDGVRQRLTNVVASREVVIWETDLISPPEDPFHCPPALAWVQFLRDGRVSRLRMFHAPRP